ncbi:MAG: aminotransferase class V-fold PLP-dependent enzyme [Candidatus Aminicenantes bacterium]|nr:aminotransferase class V-fold PLP-dependent enzyme [Candidatus Aminicenantes bacterium]
MSDPQLLSRFLEVLPRFRRRFPQLEKDVHGNKRIHLNSGAGTLTVDTAARALNEAATWLNSLPGEVYPAEIATKNFHWQIRGIAADFLNAPQPEGITFHSSTSQALVNLALSMRGLIRGRNNLIVTDIDHMANVSPWESIAGRWWGAEVRRARVTEDGRLDTDHLLSLVDPKTALLALTLASNGLGTIVPLEEIIPEVRKKSPSCLVCVDAVHHALHGPIDVQAMDCDFLAVSGYKIFGPVLGVLWGKKDILDRLAPFRVETARNETPFKFEQGSLNNAALASLGAALQYLLWVAGEVGPGAPSKDDRPAAFRRAMAAISTYERELSRIILEGLAALDPEKIKCYGIVHPAERSRRDPTFALEVTGRSPAEVKKFLWKSRGIQVADGNHYSAVFYRHLGKDSICRASFAHYISPEETREFLASLAELSA